MSNAFGIILSIVSIFAVSIVIFARLKRPKRIVPLTGDYDEMRGFIIEHVIQNERWTGNAKRPPFLDMRLKRSLGDEFAIAIGEAGSDGVGSTRFYEIYAKIVDSIEKELETITTKYTAFELLSEPRRVVRAVDDFLTGVQAEGIETYYINTNGNTASIAPDSLRRVGFEELALLAEQANAAFGEPPSARRYLRMEQVKRLDDRSLVEWEKAEMDFSKLDNRGLEEIGRYILAHRSDFFKD